MTRKDRSSDGFSPAQVVVGTGHAEGAAVGPNRASALISSKGLSGNLHERKLGPRTTAERRIAIITPHYGDRVLPSRQYLLAGRILLRPSAEEVADPGPHSAGDGRRSRLREDPDADVPVDGVAHRGQQ